MIDETVPTGARIGFRLRTQLEVRNLTIPKAAELCGIPKPTFETYLYGKNLPGALALAALAKGLGCSADWLLTGQVAR